MLFRSPDAITPQQLKQINDCLIVDVREPAEHEAQSIPGSVLIPKHKFEDRSALEVLPRDRQIVLHCRSGIRSAKCLEILKSAGFTKATHLKGGILAWEESKK